MLRDTAAFQEANAAASALDSIHWWGMAGHVMRIDQGQEGTCVGHGCTNVLMAGPVTHSDFLSFGTPDDAHQFARKLYFDATGDDTYQQGAYTRDALNVLVARGQIASYHRLGSVDEIITTLQSIGPVTFGSTWYEPMFEPRSEYENSYLQVDTRAPVAGGHLYSLTGVDLSPIHGGPQFVRMENSWGPSWAHNGTARITLEDLAKLYDGDAFLLAENRF
jgi:hypothetical protein